MSSLVNCRKRITFMIHRRLLECLFLLGIVAVTVGAEIPPDCQYQTAGGWSCHKCPKGQFVASDCVSNDPASTECRNCTGDRFQPDEWTSEKRCYSCDECDPGLDGSLGELLTACTIFENAVCRCPGAFFWSQAQRRCEEVTECPPGQGVTHPATIKADTVCEPCRQEAFSASSSAEERCDPCQICEEWQQEASPCNQTHNRVCQNVSVATGIPPTPKHPQEASDIEDSQTDNTVAIVAPAVAVVTVVAILATVVGVFFYRRKNARQQADPEVTIDPRDNQGLLDGTNSSTRSSQTSTPSGDTSSRGSISTRGSDSLQYQSEPEKPCAATPFSNDGAAGIMDNVVGPGDETYPKSFALEPEGDDPSMPVQETGGRASPGPESYLQDSHDPPQSLDKIEKESAGYAVTEIPDVPCASRSGPTPVFPSPAQIRTRGVGSSNVDIAGPVTRV